jgi:hypothetical protein
MIALLVKQCCCLPHVLLGCRLYDLQTNTVSSSRHVNFWCFQVEQKWVVFVHYLETVPVSSSTTACSTLYYMLGNCYYCAKAPVSQTNNMSSSRHVSFGALRTSKNEVCLYTISRLCLFQAVLLLAQRYNAYLTAVITAPKRQCGSRTLCLVADMPILVPSNRAKMRSVCSLSRDCACFKQYYCLRSAIQYI